MEPQDDVHLPLQQDEQIFTQISDLWQFPLLCMLLQNTLTKTQHATKPLPKDNLGVDLSQSARLPLPLDLSIVPVATLLGVVWVVVDHNNHSWLQLVPLVHCTGPWTNILYQQLNHTILWVAAIVNVIQYQSAAQRQATHHHRRFLHSAVWEWSQMYKNVFEG